MMKEFASFRFYVPSFIIASLYIILAVYLMNWKLVINTTFGPFSLKYKFDLLWALLWGMSTAMTSLGAFTLIATGLLTGINLTLIANRIFTLQSSKTTHFALGGSLLGVIGLSGSLTYLPFRSTEISIIAVILLSLALYFMIRNNKMVCGINVATAK